MPTLHTSRLILSPFTADDWSFFLALRQNPQVMRFMGEILPEAQIRRLFAARCADPGVFVIRSPQGIPWGDIGLRISAHNPHEADVGYALLPEAQGRGIASEALRAICDYGFADRGVKAINAWVLGDNAASARLLERQGFVRTQVLKQAYQLGDRYYDDWIYRLERGFPHPVG